MVIKGAGESRNFMIRLRDASATTNYIDVLVSPDTGAVVSAAANAGNATGATSTVTALANSCYRIDITGQPNTSGSNSEVVLYMANGTSLGYLGDGTSGVYIGDVQVNIGTPVGIAKVGATRAGMVTWRTAADEIDYAAQAAAAASRIIIGVGSDGEILIDDVSLEA